MCTSCQRPSPLLICGINFTFIFMRRKKKMLSLFLKRFFTLAIVATAFLGIFAYGQGRRGKCNRGWLSKKLSSGDKVIIDFEKTLLGQSHKYDPRNGCDGILLEDHAFHMGNRFTVELDCFQKLLKLGAHRGSTKDWNVASGFSKSPTSRSY